MHLRILHEQLKLIPMDLSFEFISKAGHKSGQDFSLICRSASPQQRLITIQESLHIAMFN